jgi:hypothetical protein
MMPGRAGHEGVGEASAPFFPGQSRKVKPIFNVT